MSKDVNTSFNVLAPEALDTRLVKQTYAELATIPVIYTGLRTYVIADDKTYIYKTTGWTEYILGSTGGTTALWGSITGDILNQTDLQTTLGLKFNKTGGTITGNITLPGYVATSDNFILNGSIASSLAVIGTAPALPGSTGIEGTVIFAIDGIYVCIATDTWKRILYDVWV